MYCRSSEMISAVSNRLSEYFNVAYDAVIQQRGATTASFFIPGEPDPFENDWCYRDADSLSASAYPILLREVLEDRSGLAVRKFVSRLRQGVSGGAFNQPPLSYMHHNVRNDSIVAANDIMGIGKLYYYQADDFCLVASGVIGAALGMNRLPIQDDDFWDAYYVTGGGLNNSTYVRGVSLAPPGTVITVSEQGVKLRQELEFSDFLLQPKGLTDSIEPPVNAGQNVVDVVAPYLSDESRLRLSGGVDSRFAAATLVSLGIPFTATTFVPPDLEAEIAAQLHERAEGSFDWLAVEANPGTVRQDGGTPQPPGPSSGSILQRASSWFRYLGGDHWSTPVRSNVPVRRLTPAPLMISGSHGDFTRAHYYSLRDIQEGGASSALERYLTSFVRNRSVLSEELRDHGAQLVKNELLGSLVKGIDGLYALDYSFYYNRVRRQFPPVAPSVALPMLTPEMLLRTFWVPPERKIDASAIRRMTLHMVPDWDGVPYFHEIAAELDPKTTNKVSLQDTYWETDRNDFLDSMETAIDSTDYSGLTMQTVLDEIATLPEGRNRTNQTFEFVFWHDAAKRVLADIVSLHELHPGSV